MERGYIFLFLYSNNIFGKSEWIKSNHATNNPRQVQNLVDNINRLTMIVGDWLGFARNLED